MLYASFSLVNGSAHVLVCDDVKDLPRWDTNYIITDMSKMQDGRWRIVWRERLYSFSMEPIPQSKWTVETEPLNPVVGSFFDYLLYGSIFDYFKRDKGKFTERGLYKLKTASSVEKTLFVHESNISWILGGESEDA